MADILRIQPRKITCVQNSSRHERENVVYPEQISPLQDASEQKHVKCVKFLLNNGALVNQVCNKMTPLQSTIMTLPDEDHDLSPVLEVARELLSNGAHPNVTWDNRVSRTAMLNLAVGRGYYQLVHLLLDNAAVTEHLVQDSNGNLKPYPCKYSPLTPLITAVCYIRPQGLQILLQRGARLFFRLDHPLISISSIPHFIVLQVYNEFDNSREEKQQLVADYIKLLEVYKELGANLWTRQRRGRSNQMENVLELIEFCRSSHETLLDVQEKVKKVLTTPKSLLSICRINIVGQMGRSFWPNVSQLPLPDALLEYLVHQPNHSAKENDYSIWLP
jgi:ankyrin repeat protein